MAASPNFPRIGAHRSVEAFRAHLATIASEVPVDGEILAGDASPLAQPLVLPLAPLGALGRTIGNRWAIHPMEGWDGTADGNPSELTLRRWRRFGLSGAKLIWGGEAAAVRADGRANPNQLLVSAATVSGLGLLRRTLLDAHRERFGSIDSLCVGLQLTHSGRFARDSANRPAPRIAFRHPLLDARVGVSSDAAVLSDGELEQLVEDFVRAAMHAQSAGFDFVDIKCCHGYLLHELLGAHERAGCYGGAFENRTRLLREIIAGVRRDAPGLGVAVRVSLFDIVPFRRDPENGERGAPEDYSRLLPYRYGFGVDAKKPDRINLAEPAGLLAMLEAVGVQLVNASGGSPYYNPHIQRPALFPPSDGYRPPEDPLAGVVRHLRAARDLKARFPNLVLVASALSYLQDFLPHVAQACVRAGWFDFAGLGRMALSYPELPADCLEHGRTERKRICRTFSDCTTAPRNGMVSGCYPLDAFYAARPEAERVKKLR